MKLLDIHCHVYPANVAHRVGRSVADFYGVVPGQDIAELTASPEGMLKAQKEAGIDLTVVCAAATTAHQVRPINAFLARCVEESDGKCLAFGTLRPDSDDLRGDVEHLLSMGIRGVKFHPEMQKCPLDSPGMMRILEALEDRLPILLHTGDSRFPYSNPKQLVPLLKAFPKTRFIGAHMGGFTVWQEAMEHLPGRYENLWVDLSSTEAFVGQKRLVDMIRAFGAERVLFGTDFPMWEPGLEVQRFMDLPLTREERERIGWRNGAALLSIAE